MTRSTTALNYLAHLYLADDDAESLIGSLMGDFVKGRIDEDLAPAIRWGVLLHRRIDSFTDGHPIVKRSKGRIRPGYRRYAGILIDLFYDHFLACHWPLYSDLTLDDFAERVYHVVWRHRAGLPPRMQRSMSYMVANDLLLSYREIDGIRRSLFGIEGRLSRPSRLRDAVYDLERNYAELAGDFAAFFPDLVRYVERHNRSRPVEVDSGAPRELQGKR